MRPSSSVLVNCHVFLLGIVVLVSFLGGPSALVGPCAADTHGPYSISVANKTEVTNTLALRNNTLMPGNVPSAVQRGPSGIAFDSFNNLLYVTDTGTSNVSVVDPVTRQVVDDIAVGFAPSGAVFVPSNGCIYVSAGDPGSFGGPGAIDVIDGATNTVAASINPGDRVTGMAYDSWSQRLWVGTGSSGLGSLTAYNTTTNTPSGGADPGGTPDGIAFNGENGNIYVAVENYVKVFNSATGALVATVNGARPAGVAFDSINGNVYAVNELSSIVMVIDGTTNQATAYIPVGSHSQGLPEPFDIAFNAANGMLYVANQWSNNVSVIDGSTRRLVGTIGTGEAPFAVAVDDATGDVFVTNWVSNNVTVIDGSLNRATGSILIGVTPNVVLVDRLNGSVYVAAFPSCLVTVVNETSKRIVARIQVSHPPVALDLDPLTGHVFVTTMWGPNGTVDEIDGATNRVIDSFTIGPWAKGAALDWIHGELFVFADPSVLPNVWVYNISTGAYVTEFVIFASDIAFCPVTGEMYVSSIYSAVYAIDGANNSVVKQIYLDAPRVIAYNPKNANLYISSSSEVTVVDPATKQRTAGISLSRWWNLSLVGWASAIGVDESNGLVYVAMPDVDNVVIINGATNQPLGGVAVGIDPSAVGVNGVSGEVYVANGGSGTISMLSPWPLPEETPTGTNPYAIILTIALIGASAGAVACVLWWRQRRAK